MLKQAAYLYNNIQNLYADMAPSNMGYNKMYARNMKLYKGIDNTFQIKLMNGDQKLINAVGQTISWVLLDRNTAEVKFMISKIVEGSDNSLVKITVNERDLDSTNSGMYMYSAYLTNNAGKRTILYGDSQYGASVPVEVVNNSFPQVYPSNILDEFTTDSTSRYTSAVNARPELNNNNALHTAAIYATNFNGIVNVETTLENGITDIVNWSTLQSMTVKDSDTIIHTNFNGVFTFVRFRVIPDIANTGTVDKILYRS